MSKRRAVTDAEMEAADAQRAAASRYHEALCANCGRPRNMHHQVQVFPSQLNDDIWICPTSTFQETA